MTGNLETTEKGGIETRQPSLKERIQAWDERVFKRVNDLEGRSVSWLKHYTHIAAGGNWGIVFIVFTIITWLARWPLGWLIIKIGLSNLASVGVLLLVKFKINRVRPCYTLEGVKIRTAAKYYKGPSLPSGHVQFFLSNLLVITYATGAYYPWLTGWLLAATLVLTAIVAFSRIYVGVHYPTDVIAGFITGSSIFLLTILVFYPLVFEPLFNLISALLHP